MEQLMNLAIGLMQTTTEIPSGAKSGENVGETGSFKDMLQQKTDAVAEKPAEGKKTVKNTEVQETEETEFDERTLEDVKAMLFAQQLVPMNIVVASPEETEAVVETAEALVPVVADATQESVLPETVLEMPEVALESPEAAETAEFVVDAPELPAAPQETADGLDTVEAPEDGLATETLAKPADAPLEVEQKVDVKVQDNRPEEQPHQVEERPEETLFGQVEAAPVKVAEPEQTPEAAEAENISSQLEPKITETLDQGETKVVVQLTPENLGKVTVEVTRAEEGLVHVVLKAESTRTQNLLERHINHLQSALAGNGHTDVQVEVERREEPHNEQRQDLNDQQKNHGHNQRQQEQKRRAQHSEDFLHQLRLGLVPTESIS